MARMKEVVGETEKYALLTKLVSFFKSLSGKVYGCRLGHRVLYFIFQNGHSNNA
jgi:hypothetical protein